MKDFPKVYKVGVGQIDYREPYFIKCSICDWEISGNSIEEVEREARERGWMYNYNEDLVFCPDCWAEVRENMEEEEIE